MLFTTVLTSVALATFPGFNLFGKQNSDAPQPICELRHGIPCKINMDLMYGKSYIPIRSSQPAECTCSRERFVFGWIGRFPHLAKSFTPPEADHLPKLFNGRICRLTQTNTVLEAKPLGIFTPDLNQLELLDPIPYRKKTFIQVWKTPSNGYSHILYLQEPMRNSNLGSVFVLLSETGQVSQEISSQAYQAIQHYASKDIVLKVVPQQGQCNFKK